MYYIDNGPIIAISTAHGSGGIGVIRISGESLAPIINNIFTIELNPRHATLLKIYADDSCSSVIDQVIAIYFKAPYSYTGEDVLEVQAHGNMIVLDMLMQRLLELNKHLGLRLANAGEFTQRAFLNNKIDLLQAEAIADIINANSRSAVTSANHSLNGGFSEQINSLLDKIIHLRLFVEAQIDFPEEELDYSNFIAIDKQLNNIEQNLSLIQKKAHSGYILNQGITICLVGSPNVGKSSLMNCLADKDVSIVTPIAGTTRDKISADILIDGIKVKLIDTAGLRHNSTDEIEKIGMQQTWHAIAESNLIIYLSSIEESDTVLNAENSQELLNTIADKYNNIPIIKIKNKIDLNNIKPLNEDKYLYISAKYSLNIDELKQKIKKIVGYENNAEGVFLARKRHLQALDEVKNAINMAQQYAGQRLYVDTIAEELRIAQQYINSITGAFSADDLLGKIFSQFCIGK